MTRAPIPPGSIRRGVGAFCVLALLAGAPRAEKASSSPEELFERATHVVVGEVTGIDVRRELDLPWEVDRYVVTVSVDGIEKAPEGFDSRVLEARCWFRTWRGPGPMPADTRGHWPLPAVGDRVRLHAVAEGYNGFGETTDGGMDVFGRNGWELLVSGPHAGEAFGGGELVADWRRGAVVLAAVTVVVLLLIVRRTRRRPHVAA